MTDNSGSGPPQAARPDITSALDELGEQVAALKETGDPASSRVAASLQALGKATSLIAQVTGGDRTEYEVGQLQQVRADLALMVSYDQIRRCLLVLLDLAAAFQNAPGYGSVADELQALAAQLVPALEAARNGLHPIIAYAALLLESGTSGELVLPRSAQAEIRQVLDTLAACGARANGVRSLELLGRSLADRPGGAAASAALDRTVSGAPAAG
jgi:hypothetical protein